MLARKFLIHSQERSHVEVVGVANLVRVGETLVGGAAVGDVVGVTNSVGELK